MAILGILGYVAAPMASLLPTHRVVADDDVCPVLPVVTLGLSLFPTAEDGGLRALLTIWNTVMSATHH